MLITGASSLGVILWSSSIRADLLWTTGISVSVGAAIGLFALMGRTWTVELPADRPALTAEELQFIRTPAVKQSLRGVLTAPL